MKLIFVLLFTSIVFWGCKKDSNSSTAELKTSFKYTIQGITDSIIGSASQSSTEGCIFKRKYSSGVYFYELTAFKSNPSNRGSYIGLNFHTTKLTVGTYSNIAFPSNVDYNSYYTNGAVDTEEVYTSFLDGYYGGTSYEANTTNISITKIENGYVSGTYSASKLKQAGTCTTCPTSIQVTNGIFTNVKILD